MFVSLTATGILQPSLVTSFEVKQAYIQKLLLKKSSFQRFNPAEEGNYGIMFLTQYRKVNIFFNASKFTGKVSTTSKHNVNWHF